ncbi:MAG: hypothetical protein ACRDQZ_17805, partial [Mycobacteriales bacterium]
MALNDEWSDPADGPTATRDGGSIHARRGAARKNVAATFALLRRAGALPPASAERSRVLGEILPLVRPLTKGYVGFYVGLYGESLRDYLQQAADLGTYLAAESFPQAGPELVSSAIGDSQSRRRPLDSAARREWVSHLKRHVLNEMRGVVVADLNIPSSAANSLHSLLKLLDPVERDPASAPSESELVRLFPGKSVKELRQGLAALAQVRHVSPEAVLRQGDPGDEWVPDFVPAVVHRALLAELGLSDPAAYVGSPEERERLLAVVAHGMSESDVGEAVGVSRSRVSQSVRAGLARVRAEADRAERNDARRQDDWDTGHPPILDGSHPPARRRPPGEGLPPELPTPTAGGALTVTASPISPPAPDPPLPASP